MSVGALHLNAVAGGHQVDGADPAGTAGLGAVLDARLPEGFSPLHRTISQTKGPSPTQVE